MDAASSQAHSRFVARMFAEIVPTYDGLNTAFSLGIDAYWRKTLAKAVAAKPGECVVDLAAGTLKVTKELLGMYPGTRVLALDFCQPMLEKGLEKGAPAPAELFLPAVADGLNMPLADNSVDAITVAFGLRNMRPRGAALAEMYRVLRPGGKLCVLELGSTQDKIMLGLYNFYLERIMPGIARLLFSRKGAYRYLAESIAAFPSAEQVRHEMRETGFHNVSYRRMTLGIVCLHVGTKGTPAPKQG